MRTYTRFSWVAFTVGLTVIAFTSAETACSTEALPAEQSVGPGAQEPKSPAAWYGEGVRPTERRTPQEELAGFHVPEGFIVELIAAEPQIAKPLNMAFDARGKLWLTQTIEYPYPKKEGEAGGDCVKTLEDTDGDGGFDRITTFADGLNIPMGILPYQEGAIVFSIPNLLYLRDTDGDGVCDQRDVILGPFDTTRDTHGMVNALRRGDDGWIYACHGFSNQSIVKGKDGHEVRLTSGNTFRFRADGSRVEQFTSGQVNPFGMTVDRYGNRITADCHSKPLTCLFPGACYPSFGRPDDGLGFFPSMMDHLHGSTAISGVSLYDGDSYPDDYRNQIYSGNVMTSRINRDRLDRSGATMKATEVSDFLTSDDPWFRPVDIQLGADGALYIADFYNRIIGHYEVPLEHPGRDRESGRIWRIRHRDAKRWSLRVGTDENRIESLVQELSSAMVSRRLLALDELTDIALNDEVASEQIAVIAINHLQSDHEMHQVGSLWLLHRLGRLSPDLLLKLLQAEAPFVQAHALRAGFESMSGDRASAYASLLSEARRLMESNSAEVRSWAAKVLSRLGDASDARLLVNAIGQLPVDDPMLKARLRLALRDLMVRHPSAFSDVGEKDMPNTQRQIYREIILGIRSPEVVQYIIDDLKLRGSLRESLPWIRHAVQNSDESQISSLIAILQNRCADANHNADVSPSELLRELRQVMTGRASKSLQDWVEVYAKDAMARVRRAASKGHFRVSWTVDSGPLWGLSTRAATDQQNDFQYRSSLTRGESYTGVMRSGDFVAERSMSFWIVGHNGLPGTADRHLNCVRLIDAATDNVLQEAFPPRSDTAAQVMWDLSAVQGTRVRLEVIDGDDGAAYAWIAVGRFDNPLLNQLPLEDEWNQALELITAYKVASVLPELDALVANSSIDAVLRLQALRCVAELRSNAVLVATSSILMALNADPKLQNQCLDVSVSHLDSSQAKTAYREVIRTLALTLPQREQLEMARQLASNRELAPWLIEAWEEGWLTVALSQDKTIETTLSSILTDELRGRLRVIQQHVPAVNEDAARMAKSILATALKTVGDSKKGDAIFQKQCAICHQLGGVGALVGPQLDGVGARSRERLLEDILFPDRNVDKAFRTVSLLMEDGSVRVGLIRSESPDSLELVDNAGKSHRIDTKAIDSRNIGGRSLMPDGQHETLGTNGMIDLLTYLEEKASQATSR